MLHHEVGFCEIEHRQRAPCILSGSHQLGLLEGTGITIVRVTDDEDFPSLETLLERGVEPLQPGDRQSGIVLGQLQQHLGERHAFGHHVETRLQRAWHRSHRALHEAFRMGAGRCLGRHCATVRKCLPG
ncbi:hypothetical protein D3C81_1829370 [compost metagenome]